MDDKTTPKLLLYTIEKDPVFLDKDKSLSHHEQTSEVNGISITQSARNVPFGVREKREPTSRDDRKVINKDPEGAEAKRVKGPTKLSLQKWLVLVAAFVCQMASLGFAFSLGVFFVEFLASFPEGRGVVAWATSICSGITYGAGLGVGMFIHKFGPRLSTILGGFVATGGVLASSFATSLVFLYLTFGLVTGAGLCLVQMSSAVALGHHFTKGRGAATSIAAVGAGLGSLSFPLILRFLIDKYGWRGAMMIFSGVLLNCVPIGGLFVPSKHERVVKRKEAIDEEDGKSSMAQAVCNTAIWKNKMYILYLIMCPIISTGYSFPYVALVDLGILRGIDIERSTLLLTYISIATAISTFLMGGLLRLFFRHSVKLFTISTVLMSVVLFIFPSLVSYPTLVVGAVAYGIAMGGLTGTYAIVVVDMIGLSLYATGFGFVCTGYGVGYLLGTPVAGWINDTTGSYDKSFYVAGCLCLGPVIVFALAQIIAFIRSRRD